MNTSQTHPRQSDADDRTEEIRREAERAIIECETAVDLANRITRQPSAADRLVFIDRLDAFYTKLLRLGRREVLADRFDRPEPKFGDLTDFFRAHRDQARHDLAAPAPAPPPRPSHITPAAAVRLISQQKKASEPRQSTPNTQINMTVTINGNAQVFETGSCPTINIEHFGAAEQVNLPADNPQPHPQPAQEPERHFPYFSREATDKDKQEFETRLAETAPKGNRYAVETLNAFAYYLDLRGVRTTDLHRELQKWGLGSKYCSFNSAMANCKCVR